VLAAIFAFVVKTNRRDALPYVHAGWAIALVLGAATWFAAAFLVDVSGADREVTEGVTALLAAAILIYVGLWLHSKSYAQHWQQFIKEQVGAALAKKTLWAMAAVSFLAVYRELFEIVLFYQALWVQAGAAGRAPLFGGMVTASAILLMLGWLIFKYSMRLPIGAFFTVTSAMIAVLAVAFAGRGVAALQEAGKVPLNSVDFVTIPALGIFPTLQSLLAQLVVLLVVIGGFYLAGRSARAQRPRGQAQA
jgi:high-affinity iron transporter